MPEKIGKYQIVERLGRGGMGTIFKARDPVLDRLVALKVISTEGEVTDELRARFFREAQACARLSHPNIVTVYAMGDDDGQLFIVMELLEGEELKHLIAQRKALALEDKLSIMAQVCDGLHYAHQKGIVHRDIRPGNIFLLRSGQVKILDFGIAQMANTEGGLTRPGLILGRGRYVSPEQVRGRVDHRSDIFSVGAVLYEFLSMRPPFTGGDPMHLLEQLRTGEPPALDELDPTIPSELAAVVARAMRKDPAERFTDLEQMRSQLEEVQRGLTEEARRLSARVRDQRGRLLQLRAALVERVGPSRENEPVPTLDEHARLATVQALARDFSARLEALQARITQADSLAPALRRATLLLQAGQGAEAVGEFEAILAEMPEHARALDGLEQARAQVEMQRRRQIAAKLVQDARAALDEGSLTLCLEILEQAAQIPPPAEAAEEIASLREAVEAAVAAREAVRRARQEAEGARARMDQARRAAQSQAGPQYAPALWNEAEVKSTEAATALAHEASVEARQSFELAITVYRHFEEAAREAQRREHEAAEQARSQAAQGRQRAQAEGARQCAREQWDAAEAKSAEAQTAYAQEVFGRAVEIFNETFDLYGRAEEAAREARQREFRRAEEARRQVARSRDLAQTAGAPHYTREQWDTAEARLTEAEAAFVRHAYAQAGQAFDGAAATYQSLEEAAREARRHEREVAEQQTILQSERALDSPTVLAEPPTERIDAPTEQIEAPTVLAEPAVLVEASTVFDGPPAVVTHAPGAPVEAMPPRWPTHRRGKSATGAAVADVRKPEPGSSFGLRRVTMVAVGGLAVIGLGALLWLPRGPSTGPRPGPPVNQGQSGSPTSTAGRPEAPSPPQPEQAADPSVPPPSPRMVDNPLTPRQALHEVFEGRDPAHSVTATVVKDAVRIGRDNLGFSLTSSRPGYVYVMLVRSNGSDVELLLPNAVEPNNYIERGRPLKLPGPQWPLKAQGPPGTNEFLAIVSDEPRDFSALGPASESVFKRFRLGGRRLARGPSASPPLFAGTVTCGSATRCSESYGAVAFSIDTVGPEPEARHAARRSPAATAPAARGRHEASPRCSDILERASLGDPLTPEEQTILTRDCR